MGVVAYNVYIWWFVFSGIGLVIGKNRITMFRSGVMWSILYKESISNGFLWLLWLNQGSDTYKKIVKMI